MSTFKPIRIGIQHVLSLLAAGILLIVPTADVRAENAVDDTDLLFECVQTTYGQNTSGEKSVQFSVVSKEDESSAQELSKKDVSVKTEVSEAQKAEVNEISPKEAVSLPLADETDLSLPDLSAEPTREIEQIEKETAVKAAAEKAAENKVSEKPLTARKTKAKPIERIVPQPASKDVVVRTPSSEKATTKPQIGNMSNLEEQSLDDEELESVGPFQVYRESEELSVVTRRSMLMRTKHNLIRTAIVDPSICDIVQFTPREISIIGRSVGSTHVTFWFEDGTFKPVTFIVNTLPDPSLRDRRAEQFKQLEKHISEMFPNSKVKLILLANKLIIRGQVRNAEEASEILRILREDTENFSNSRNANAVSLQDETGLPVADGLIIVNQLRIPGVQQVSLKVKLADLSRSNGTSSGVDFQVNIDGGKAVVSSLMGAFSGGGGLLTYSSADVKIGLDYLVGEGIVRQMSESTLVTMSGTSASLSTGGEIPVPTVTGVDGASAVSTSFRPYGTVINFLPIVMDKDLIRLKISSEFSSLSDEGNEISGVPNLESRSLDSDVQMREGQTFALGTTLEDNYSANNHSNLPIFSNLIGHKSKSRGEREMVILVSPELVCPMEPDEVPPLPGFDVTEPTNAQFHILGRLEGTPTRDYRSTVWPSLRNRYLSGGSAIISGPYGH
ncbi:MAG: hypothetical protein E7028_02050 [Planctomycetaceae bacterium]|nr:hypothetical protein [Planctomycetaceae bacterium]